MPQTASPRRRGPLLAVLGVVLVALVAVGAPAPASAATDATSNVNKISITASTTDVRPWDVGQPRSLVFHVYGSQTTDWRNPSGQFRFTLTKSNGEVVRDDIDSFMGSGSVAEYWTAWSGSDLPLDVAPGDYIATASTSVADSYGDTYWDRMDSVMVTVHAPHVTSAAIESSSSTLIPSRGAPSDLTTITTSTSTTAAGPIAGSGAVKIVPVGDPSTTIASWTVDSSADRTLTWDGRVDGQPKLGEYEVVYSFTDGAGNTVTDTKPLSVLGVGADVASLKSSRSSIYPAVDRDRDTTTLTGAASTTTGAELAGQGWIRVADASGAVVWSRAVSSSAPVSFAWNGRVGRAVKPGAYTATYSFTGPEGPAATASVSLTVHATSARSASLRTAFRTIYPAKDGYRDRVRLRFGSTSTTGRAIAGAGSVTIRNSRGHAVRTWRLSSSASRSVTWNGRSSGRLVPGTFGVTYRFRGPEGRTLVKRTSLRVSARHLVTVYREKRMTAWSVFRDCDNINGTFDPCDRGDIGGNGDGARIYSAGGDTSMLVGSSVAIGGFPMKWRLKLGRVVPDYGDPRFYYDATGLNGGDSATWHAKMAFPHHSDYDGTTVTTPWSTHSYQGRGRFVLHSSDWGSLYLRSVTLQAYTRVLR